MCCLKIYQRICCTREIQRHCFISVQYKIWPSFPLCHVAHITSPKEADGNKPPFLRRHLAKLSHHLNVKTQRWQKPH